MAWYDTGTISVTNGSTAVTGSGTQFISGAQVGEAMLIDNVLYEIQSIVSATSITLADNYLGSSQSGLSYKIIPTQSLVADLSASVTSLISDYSTIANNAGAGKFNDGTVTSPGIQFLQDSDNGLFRVGSNNWGLVAGGSKIIDVSTSGIDVTGTATIDEVTVSGGLDVDGITRLDAVDIDGSVDISGNLNMSSSGLIRTTDGTAANPGIRIGVDNDNGLYRPASNTIGFSTGGTERMRISASGFVGIGTNPLVKTHVASDVSAGSIVDSLLVTQNTSSSTSGQGARVLLSSLNASNRAAGIAAIAGGSSNHDLAFYTNGNFASPTEKMRIDHAGRVGIGSDSPASTLEISKNDQTNGATLSITNSNNESNWNAGDTIGTIDFRTDDLSTTQPIRGQIKLFDDEAANSTYPYANAMSFSTGYLNTLNERMRISSDGFVGIGTALPSETLSVESSNNNAILLNSPANRYNAVGFQSAGADKWWMGRADTDVIAGDAFFIGADVGNATDAGGTSAKLVIGSSGNVGIGTDSPSANLHVLSAGNGEIEVERASGTLINIQAQSAKGIIGTDSNHDLGLKTNGAVRLTLDASGHVIIPEGVTLGTSAGVYSAANTLDSYETGNFTPVFKDSSNNSASAGTASGTYTKIGSVVHVQGVLLNINTTGLTGGDTALLTGLPFVINTASATRPHGLLQTNDVAFAEGTPYIQGIHNQSKCGFKFNKTGAVAQQMAVNTFTSGVADVFFSLSYQTT